MKAEVRQNVAALVAGVLFSFGLGLSGMTEPAKIAGFLDVFGQWDPALAFVMAGAIGVHMPVFLWLRRRSLAAAAGCGVTPVGAGTRARLKDPALLGGAALFGVGWGVTGFCPAPALVGVGAGALGAAPFAVTMILGMAVHALWSASRGAIPVEPGASPAADLNL